MQRQRSKSLSSGFSDDETSRQMPGLESLIEGEKMSEYDAAEKLLSLGGQHYMFKRMEQGTIVGSDGFNSEGGGLLGNRPQTTYFLSNADSTDSNQMTFDEK